MEDTAEKHSGGDDVARKEQAEDAGSFHGDHNQAGAERHLGDADLEYVADGDQQIR